jgi:flagellar basal-body rod protein FlgG
MAITALNSAASGMKALDTKLNVVANNIANIDTVGFKRSRTNFEDLLYQVRREPGGLNGLQEEIPHGIQVGLGVMVSGTQLTFEQGSLNPTNRPLDLAIRGEGFFRVQTIYNGNETIGYTRAGNFTVNRNGELVLGNSEGSRLEPPVTIPADADHSSIVIGQDGQVLVQQPGNAALTSVGQIQLARFVNPEGLKQVGKNLYAETDASGTPVEGNPQSDGLGELVRNHLEGSNVDPVKELVELIFTQRAFELNSQSIQSADQTLQIVGNLRRF